MDPFDVFISDTSWASGTSLHTWDYGLLLLINSNKKWTCLLHWQVNEVDSAALASGCDENMFITMQVLISSTSSCSFTINKYPFIQGQEPRCFSCCLCREAGSDCECAQYSPTVLSLIRRSRPKLWMEVRAELTRGSVASGGDNKMFLSFLWGGVKESNQNTSVRDFLSGPASPCLSVWCQNMSHCYSIYKTSVCETTSIPAVIYYIFMTLQQVVNHNNTLMVLDLSHKIHIVL